MVSSYNANADLVIKATNLNGLSSYGNIMIGDKALEFYSEKNHNDFIQIPWSEIELVTAEVVFNKKIPRFAIHTKSNGDFIFTTRDNKLTLRHINKYLPSDKLRRSLSILGFLKMKVKNIGRK